MRRLRIADEGWGARIERRSEGKLRSNRFGKLRAGGCGVGRPAHSSVSPAHSTVLDFALFGALDFLLQYSPILRGRAGELFVKMRVCESIVVQN
jgi:hypothetical protein